jgi:Domain of unknown function (DUF4333)
VPGSIVRTVLAVSAAGVLAGCSSSLLTVSRGDVVKQINAKMTDANGNKPESVDCPGDLDAKVGAQLNCTMQVRKKVYGVNVTVTSVRGNDVRFDMVETVDKSVIENEISAKVAQQSGTPPESVLCPDNLKGVNGATLRCDMTKGGTTVQVEVRVTSIYGGIVTFDINVVDHPSG